MNKILQQGIETSESGRGGMIKAEPRGGRVMKWSDDILHPPADTLLSTKD